MQPLGPLANQKVEFVLATSTEERGRLPLDANDCRRETEKELEQVRENNDAWPAAPVKVDVVSVKRDGTLTETEFPTEQHMDLPTRIRNAGEEQARKAAKEKEDEEDWEDLARPPSEDREDNNNEDEDTGDEDTDTENDKDTGGLDVENVMS